MNTLKENYLYKHNRKDYEKVQFSIKLKNETIRMPREEITVQGGTYFLWPFNQQMDKVLLKYATVQPICSMEEESGSTFFFFEDDGIPAEYLFTDEAIQEVRTQNGSVQKGKNVWFGILMVLGSLPKKACRFISSKIKTNL